MDFFDSFYWNDAKVDPVPEIKKVKERR